MAFASYYSDNMVLQRAPVEAVVWGYAFAIGDEVTVTLSSATSGPMDVVTEAYPGSKRYYSLNLILNDN